MNLVDSALRRPITVLVAIVSIALGAVLALQRMRVDILPDLGVPVIYVAQPYGGMDPAQMEGYLTYYYEYHFLYITGIEHVESKSIQGVSLIKLYFHPGVNMAQAMAETISYVNRARAFMPPGTVPPFVMRFDAGSVPVGDLVFSSETRSLGEMQDLALNRVRPEFSRLPGVSAPPPFGGSQRTVVIRVDPERLRAYTMSPDEVVKAIAAANTISPSGNIRIGDRMPMVPVNAVVPDVKQLESIPIRMTGGNPVFLRDIGDAKDSSDIPAGYALVNGNRTVYIPVTKRADASTLDVVKTVKANLKRFQSLVPDDIKVSYEFDQSPYVTRAIGGLTFEGLLGALLTGLMVLLFLRDWRSALVVVLNIPLALLGAVVALWLTGQTINLMTLGGLALAIGILVDMSTVAIENIHTHLARGKRLATAVFDAIRETAVPLLLAMLCVLAVFLPSFSMTGVGRALFVPLSLAVGFSMAASYLLSMTFVPVISTWILKHHPAEPEGHAAEPAAPGVDAGENTSRNRLRRSAVPTFAEFAERYRSSLHRAMGFRGPLVIGYLVAATLVVVLLLPRLGTEIFPKVDTGQLRLRLRAPTGTRIEKTEQLLLQTLDTIRNQVGAGNLASSLAFVGVQPSSYPINTIHLWTSGPEEAVLQVQLKEGVRIPVDPLKEQLREKLAARLPEVRVSFEPADIVGQVMSFGSPTPIEVAVAGPNLADDRDHADKIRAALAGIPALRDLQYGQSLDYPTVAVMVDRERAGMTGITTQDVARSLVAATSSSRFTQPNYWADPKTGIAYQVQVQIPTKRMESLEEIKNLTVSTGSDNQVLLRNVASVAPSTAVGEYDRYNTQRMLTLTANVVGEDLGAAASQIRAAVQKAGEPPQRVTVSVRGQIAPMEEMLSSLQVGLLAAILVIFLLLAANFQSLRLSLVTVSSVPAVLAGVVIALWLSRTTLNLQSYMGAIMAIGVAVANAILLVTFAERARVSEQTPTAEDAAVEGARSRLRPILMTSAAMIAGMVPMALGMTEGGEQTAPLGRAVIGGLAAATFATLVVLPSVFALVQGRASVQSASLSPTDPTSAHFDQELVDSGS
jgi:multidrug efflux pump subunit AcrB